MRVYICVWVREESWTIAHGRVSQAAWQHAAWMQFVWDSWMKSVRHHEVKSPTVQKRCRGTGQCSVLINKLYSSREVWWDISMTQTSGARGLKQTLCNNRGTRADICAWWSVTSWMNRCHCRLLSLDQNCAVDHLNQHELFLFSPGGVLLWGSAPGRDQADVDLSTAGYKGELLLCLTSLSCHCPGTLSFLPWQTHNQNKGLKLYSTVLWYMSAIFINNTWSSILEVLRV